MSQNILHRVDFEQFIGRDAEGSVFDVTDIIRWRYYEGTEENYYKLP